MTIFIFYLKLKLAILFFYSFFYATNIILLELVYLCPEELRRFGLAFFYFQKSYLFLFAVEHDYIKESSNSISSDSLKESDESEESKEWSFEGPYFMYL